MGDKYFQFKIIIYFHIHFKKVIIMYVYEPLYYLLANFTEKKHSSNLKL